MKRLALASLLSSLCLIGGCASHKQLACRFVAVDSRGNVLAKPTSQMHSHWHSGMPNCESMIDALASGLIVSTTTGNIAGVQVRGPKAEREKLKQLMMPEPAPKLGVAEVRQPHFATIGKVAE